MEYVRMVEKSTIIRVFVHNSYVGHIIDFCILNTFKQQFILLVGV